jgi:hypothetical protein
MGLGSASLARLRAYASRRSHHGHSGPRACFACVCTRASVCDRGRVCVFGTPAARFAEPLAEAHDGERLSRFEELIEVGRPWRIQSFNPLVCVVMLDVRL